MSLLFHKYNTTDDKNAVGPLTAGDLPEPTNNFAGWLCYFVNLFNSLKCQLDKCCDVACQAFALASQSQEETCTVFQSTSADTLTDLNGSNVLVKWDSGDVACTSEYLLTGGNTTVKLNNASGAQYVIYCSLPFTGSAVGVALSLEFRVNGAVTIGKAYSPAVSTITKPETVSLSKVIDGSALADGSQVRCVVNGVGGAGTATVVSSNAILYIQRIA